MRVTDAAQRLQRSAYPEAYEQWANSAAILTQALVGKVPTSLSCARLGPAPTRGAVAIAAIGAGLRADWGDLQTVEFSGGITVPAASAAAGWQLAHWLVANAAKRGISRVHYTDQEWTAKSGQWTKSGAPASDVVAEVYSA